MPRNNNENVATFRESKMASIRSNATCNCANMQFVHMRTYLESVIIDSILFFSISFVKAAHTPHNFVHRRVVFFSMKFYFYSRKLFKKKYSVIERN